MLRKCCCCYSLERGGLIIAWLGICISIIFAVLGIIFGVYLIEAGKDRTKNNIYGDEEIKRGAALINLVGISSIVISVIQCVVTVLTSTLIIYGIDKDKHKYLLPWLVITALVAILIVATDIAFLTAAIMFYGTIEYIICAIALIITIAPSIYLWFVILSLYKEIKSKHLRYTTVTDRIVHRVTDDFPRQDISQL